MECIQCGRDDGAEYPSHISICISCQEENGSCPHCGSFDDCDREACEHAAMEEFEEEIERINQRRNWK